MQPSPRNQILIYTGRSGEPVIDMQTEGETVWLTQAKLAELFDKSKQNISLHIQHIFQQGELSREATVKKYLTVQTEGNRKVFRNIETEYKKYQATTFSPVEKAYFGSVNKKPTFAIIPKGFLWNYLNSPSIRRIEP